MSASTLPGVFRLARLYVGPVFGSLGYFVAEVKEVESGACVAHVLGREAAEAEARASLFVDSVNNARGEG